MNVLARCITGGFRPVELKGYLAFVSTYFWGLILLAWLSFPAEHKFSIMTHTFSFLGSFEEKHNPEWWWIFSIAMVSWGLLTMPLVLYFHRRMAAISRWGARAGSFLLFLGCAGISLVGIFPDANPHLFGSIRWTDIHMKAALFVAVGFIFGIACYGVLLLVDRFYLPPSKYALRFDHRKLMWPYLLWLAVFSVSAYFLGRWEFVYPRWKAAATAAGVDIGSAWGAALGTRYSFPLWEQMLIYTLFIFLVWFSLALPSETATEAASRPKENRNSESR
jgi:hypothetical membrane protein